MATDPPTDAPCTSDAAVSAGALGHPDDNHVRRLVGYAAAAQYLGLALGTLRSMVSRRQVPHVRLSARVVRFDLADLDALIAACRIETGHRGGSS